MPALLGVLLMHAGVGVPVPRLIRALWDPSPPASATANLRTYVHTLRGQLGGAGERLVSLPGGYRFDIEQCELDLLRFEMRATVGEAALRRGDLETAETALAGAIALWRGPAFDGLELCSWVRAKITALEDRHWAVLSAWVDTRLALGLHDEVVSRLREMVAERPLCERSWVQLTAALYATGQTGEALATFTTARRTLIEELGMEPGPQLCRLQEAILAGDQEVVAIATSAPAAVTVAGGSARIGCHLPADIHNFVDHDDVVDNVVRLLHPDPDAPAPPVVALCGPPGIGKTTTAVHVAHRLRESYPDGQLYCASRGRTVDRILVELLRMLGVAKHEVPGALQERVALYRALLAERRVLVVIDDVADAVQFGPLVPGPGPAAVIATSQSRMCGLNPGTAVHLTGLAEADAVELLASFVDHCRIDTEPAAVARVVEVCEGLPLALAIAGARLRNRPLWPVSSLAARLSDESALLDEFTFGAQSVRTVLDTAYRQQCPEVQCAYRNLSRLREQTFTADAIARQLGVNDLMADRLVETLVRVSMIETVNAVDRHEPVYRISRLSRIFAREMLAKDQPEPTVLSASVAPPPRRSGDLLAVERVNGRKLP